jgi:hypothetical protein
MHQLIEARLRDLRSEYERGQTHLRLLEAQLTSVRETLIRISGAITVLEEFLTSPSSSITNEGQRPAESSADDKLRVQGK